MHQDRGKVPEIRGTFKEVYRDIIVDYIILWYILLYYIIYVGDILELYWDNGKENGNYHLGFRV